jgi:hypothetical protein
MLFPFSLSLSLSLSLSHTHTHTHTLSFSLKFLSFLSSPSFLPNYKSPVTPFCFRIHSLSLSLSRCTNTLSYTHTHSLSLSQPSLSSYNQYSINDIWRLHYGMRQPGKWRWFNHCQTWLKYITTCKPAGFQPSKLQTHTKSDFVSERERVCVCVCVLNEILSSRRRRLIITWISLKRGKKRTAEELDQCWGNYITFDFICCFIFMQVWSKE